MTGRLWWLFCCLTILLKKLIIDRIRVAFQSQIFECEHHITVTQLELVILNGISISRQWCYFHRFLVDNSTSHLPAQSPATIASFLYRLTRQTFSPSIILDSTTHSLNLHFGQRTVKEHNQYSSLIALWVSCYILTPSPMQNWPCFMFYICL